MLSALPLLLFFLSATSAFKWSLHDVLPSKKVLTFSERYMFSTENGPPMLEQGPSYINVDCNVIAYMTKNQSTSVGYAMYAALENHHHDSLQGICDSTDLSENYWAMNVYLRRVPTSYIGVQSIVDNTLGLNGTYFLWMAHLHGKYTVHIEEWHNVAFQLCSNEGAGPMAKIDGEVTFRNPYGYIPAELFGFLPFEGARMIAYVLFGVVYCYFYFKHLESTLHIHKAVLAVFLIALGEATTWYAAYQTINLTGQPYCCPFPTTVVASLVLQVFRQTFSRALLLVVSLGYGIVRPKLLPAEWIATIIVTILYFIAAVVAQVSEIVVVNDVHGDSPETAVSYQIPEMIMDIVFLSWIYLALGSTVRILTEFQQTYKLQMYRQLAYTIAFFVSLFALVTVLILLDKNGIIRWPWQWAWAQQILWEVLNFAVLASVCIICCPSDNSRLLSYASQLPTEDPDDDDKDYDHGPDDEEHDGKAEDDSNIGAWSFRKREAKDKGDGDYEMTSGAWKSASVSSSSNRVSIGAGAGAGMNDFTSLPAAEEDGEFGLR